MGAAPAAERAYSAAWSLFGVLLLVVLVRELDGSWLTGAAAGVLAAVSPLDIYYAQEARMYSQAAALGVLSTWFLVRWLGSRQRAPGAANGLWLVGYTVTALALMGTHYVTVTILLAQGFWVLGWQVRRRDWAGVGTYLVASAACAAAFLPWVLYVAGLSGRLFNADRAGWIPLPTVHDLWLLATRDLTWGRAGFDAGEWRLAAAAALALWAIVVTRAFRRRSGPRRERQEDSVRSSLVLAWMLVAPVTIAVVVSVSWHPVFYRPRFSVLVLPYFLGLLAVSFYRRRRWRRNVPLIIVAGLMLSATISQARAPQKTGLAEFASLWRAQGPPDFVLFYPRWNRRVAGYYLGAPVSNVPTRRQLAQALHGSRRIRLWICARHGHPPNDATGQLDEYRWALSLGPHHLVARVDTVEDVIEVDAQPQRRSFPPLPPDGRIDLTDEASQRYLWTGWYRPERRFRWTRGTRAEIVFGLGERRPTSLDIEAGCFQKQRVTALLNGREVAHLECAKRAPHLLRVPIPRSVTEEQNSLVLVLPDAARPSETKGSRDSRRLALAVRWLAFRP